MQRRDPAQDEATAQLRRRQSAAPWLRDLSPHTKSLRLTFDEEREDGTSTSRGYAQPVVVESARAHFEVRCLEPRCNGLHDFTPQIVRAMKERRTSDSVRSSCDGAIKDVQCNRTLVCSFQIGYRD